MLRLDWQLIFYLAFFVDFSLLIQWSADPFVYVQTLINDVQGQGQNGKKRFPRTKPPDGTRRGKEGERNVVATIANKPVITRQGLLPCNTLMDLPEQLWLTDWLTASDCVGDGDGDRDCDRDRDWDRGRDRLYP